jgi:serine/threonine protein phosphatase PrpC
MNVAGATDIGQIRQSNEDSILLLNHYGLFAVADGMGGSRGGKVASQIVTGELARAALSTESGLAADELVSVLRTINERIFRLGSRTDALARMGTTCTAASIVGGHLALAHVGDSRAYMARDGKAWRLTADHRFVQDMIDQGRLTEDEASQHPYRNVLTRGVGVRESIDVDLLEQDLQAGDALLLCSDGLSDMVREEQILEAVASDRRPDVLVNELVQMANDFGGSDNVSVIVIRVEAADIKSA